MRKKKKNKTENIENNYFRKVKKEKLVHYITRSILILFSILVVIALASKNANLNADIQMLRNWSLKEMLTLNFPPVTNNIGPFGAFFAYYFNLLFGRFISISFLISFSVLLFLRNLKIKVYNKFLIFLLFILSIDIVIKNTYKFPELMSCAIVPRYLTNLLNNIFKTTGTYIIAITGFILCFIYLASIDVVLKIIKNIYRFLKYISRSITSFFFEMFNSEYVEEEPYTKEIKKKNKINEDIGNDNKQEINIEFNDNQHKNKKNDVTEQPVINTNIIYPEKIKFSNENESNSNDDYRLPEIDVILSDYTVEHKRNKREIEEIIAITSEIIINKLREFDITAEVVNVNVGPIITQYEIKPAPGMKVSRFSSVSDDLALAIKAKSIRIEAPIPGRGLIGVEVPNENRDIIYLKELLLSQRMRSVNSLLAFPLGKNISGSPIVVDLGKMPHLLMAGATGSGKSVTINSIICSILIRTKPEDVRLILIDPKRIELSGYEGIPHLIQKVVTEPHDALSVLNWAVTEMERRYSLLQEHKVRDIDSFNNRVKNMQNRFKLDESDQNSDNHNPTLPFIVIIVDEFADLIMTAGREIELPITRLAQMARAIGIHLILATQRPSIKVITGIIKANFPARIAFQVSSKIDSRVIIDVNGAEKLLGKGDMLFIPPGKGTPDRIHGAYLSDEEIEKLVDYLRSQPKPVDDIEIITENNETNETFDYDDPIFPDAAKLVVKTDAASVSMLQRHFKIGYARAGRLIDLLERAKIVGPHLGSKSRDVLMTEEDLNKYDF